MAIINHSKREINAKIVLYGPPDSGKASLLRFLQQRIKPTLCGSLKTMETGGDSLVFFDYVPFEQSSLDGYRICFHLYTLTGNVANAGAWKMVLKGVDGLALVVGKECQQGGDGLVPLLSNLRSILGGYGRDVSALPLVVLSVGDVSSAVMGSDLCSAATFSMTGLHDDGALSALAELSRQVMQSLRNEFKACDRAASVRAYPAEERDETAVREYDGRAGEDVTIPPVTLAPSLPVSVRMPVRLTVDGRECRYILSATLQLEPEA